MKRAFRHLIAAGVLALAAAPLAHAAPSFTLTLNAPFQTAYLGWNDVIAYAGTITNTGDVNLYFDGSAYPAWTPPEPSWADAALQLGDGLTTFFWGPLWDQNNPLAVGASYTGEIFRMVLAGASIDDPAGIVDTASGQLLMTLMTGDYDPFNPDPNKIAFTAANFSLTLYGTPEPGTLLSLLLAGGIVGLRRRRQRRA